MAALLTFAGCGQGTSATAKDAGADGGPPVGQLARADLLDPKVCGSCHADHYADWVASMHAFASDDPIFIAMNARGQRETDGGLGTFCVNCHAPMAVRDGLTTDGLNLASLPSKYRGVTCFFCHSIASVDGAHNASVTLASDLVMRGEYRDPVPSYGHLSAYATFQDVTSADSAAACGACHDITVPAQLDGDAGTPIERTFAEWKASAFSGTAGLETCASSGCHMVKSPTERPIAQQTGLHTGAAPPSRYVHGHEFAAIDVPLPTSADGGGLDGGVAETPGVQALLANALQGDLCVTQAGGIRVIVDAPNLGHDFPSGAAQDRRVWAEVVAYKGGAIVYQSGSVPFGTPAFDAGADPDLWLMRDCIFGTDGREVNMFWQAAGYDGNELQALATFDPTDSRFYQGQRLQAFPRDGTPLATGAPDRVTLTLWVQPVGADVLADLVDSGDLAPAIAAAVPKFPVPVGAQAAGAAVQTQLEWTAAAAAAAGVTFQRQDQLDGTLQQCVGSLPAPNPSAAMSHSRCAP